MAHKKPGTAPRALQDYVRQHAPDAVTEAYNRVCSEVESQPDEFVRRAARATFKRAVTLDRGAFLERMGKLVRAKLELMFSGIDIVLDRRT